MVREIVRALFEIIAIYAEKINIYNEKRVWKYQSILMIIYNIICSVFLSLIGSVMFSLILTIFTRDFLSSWHIAFKTLLVLNGLMIVLNLGTKKLNIPMLFLKAVFYIKEKFTSMNSFVRYTVIPYTFTILTLYYMYYIILDFLNGFGIRGETAEVYSIVLSVGLAVAGAYSFPVEKDVRDFNELIISPVLIVSNIGISYVLAKKNALNNLKQGQEDIASYVFILFLIAACLQVITYFKKLFEKLHDSELSKYEEVIGDYAVNGNERIAAVKGYMQLMSVEVGKVIKDFKGLKEFKKDKYVYFYFFICFTISVLLFIGGSYISETIIVRFKKPISMVCKYILLLLILVVLYKKLSFYVLSMLKDEEGLSKRKKWEYFGLAFFIFGMLLFFIMILLSINLSYIIVTIIMFIFLISMFILGILSIINWLLRKEKLDEKVTDEKNKGV
ncbi:teichoic acid transporter [Bacillus mycoides]|uniref:teichoic acid transporter n=1 Tax=Bacillus mycoides TaxID=1405 RepID=UPI002734B219|nr:teichoic acid transporter [Bacillus mycoides]